MLPVQKQFHSCIIDRARVLLVVLMAVLSGLIGRLFWIQCVETENYSKKAHRQHWSKERTMGDRGTVRDRNGEVFAVSETGYSCYADPKHVKNVSETAKTLATICKVSEHKLQKRLEHPNRRFVWLKRQLSVEVAEQIKVLKLSGIGFRKEPRRVYPHNKTAAAILGFVGLDHEGLHGLEASFEKELKGEDGYLWKLVDGRLSRFAIYTSEGHYKDPIDGADVYLTIDLVLQNIVEQNLQELMAKHRPDAACITVLHVATGEVLAMASAPHFNPQEYRNYPQSTWRNIATSNVYELGSVIKPLIVAAALTERVVHPATEIFCHNGAYRANKRTLHDHHRYGNLTVEEIVVKSSNIGVAIVGEQLGAEKLHGYLRHLGFAQKSGIYLPGEEAGLLRHFRKWHPTSMMSITMGHEIGITPLQMVAAFNTIAADGVYRAPTIVRKIKYPDGRILHRYPQNAKRIFPVSIAREMRRILRRVVVDGTARRANIKGVLVAGKTGTAQKIMANGKYSHSKHIASFVGFAPYHQPVYCCIVTADAPTGVQYGGSVSAPTAARILRQALLVKEGKL